MSIIFDERGLEMFILKKISSIVERVVIEMMKSIDEDTTISTKQRK